MINKLDGRDIICIGPVDWDPIWNRSQQLMSRLPGSNRVLYIEPPATLISAFKDRSLWFKWWQWLKGARSKTENIILFSPPPILPFGYMYPLVNSLNQRWLLLFVGRIAKKLGFKNPIVWTYLPNALSMARGLNPTSIIYDCVDEHSEFPGLINKEAVLEMEKELLAGTDLVFTSALGLYQAKRPYAKNIYLVPNAADVGHFARAARKETPVPEEIACIPRPLLGFVGVIHDWIDLELIEFVARQKPDWSVAMIGPVGPGINITRFKDLPNVHFFGRKDKEELPGYIKAFDVCLNPFRKNQLTDRVSPLKLYEYLASGRPVVSVEMPGVLEFRDVIEIATDYNSFIASVQKALTQENEEKKNHRLDIASHNSWENRLAYMSGRINEILVISNRCGLKPINQ